jgi:hypothetical protein
MPVANGLVVDVFDYRYTKLLEAPTNVPRPGAYNNNNKSLMLKIYVATTTGTMLVSNLQGAFLLKTEKFPSDLVG